jgi:hypothetical protein
MRVRMISGVKRVTVLRPGMVRAELRTARDDRAETFDDDLRFTIIDPSGQVQRGVMRADLGPAKKQSRTVKRIDRRLRKLIRKEQGALGRYLVLHERSKRQKKNGWVRDLGKNIKRVIRGS